jgi:uncharacterized membrane protein YeaQ/YmgE (transglycosylase-associated protein family)
VGQISASVGYTVYSFLLHNWVYVSSNIAILLTAIIGECIFLRNRRVAQRRTSSQTSVAAQSAEPAG